MRSFEAPQMQPSGFVEAIREKLSAKGYDRYVSVELEGDRIRVQLRWMGTTRFDYRIDPAKDGFRAELISQKISPFHAAFADRFEGYFDEALAKVGAKAF